VVKVVVLRALCRRAVACDVRVEGPVHLRLFLSLAAPVRRRQALSKMSLRLAREAESRLKRLMRDPAHGPEHEADVRAATSALRSEYRRLLVEQPDVAHAQV
jgi:hypothetical protein